MGNHKFLVILILIILLLALGFSSLVSHLVVAVLRLRMPVREDTVIHHTTGCHTSTHEIPTTICPNPKTKV